MSLAIFGGVEIPAVTFQEVSREFVGDRSRTAGGKMRQDAVAIKHIWQLRTGKMTKAVSDAIIDKVVSVFGGPDEFWIDEFGDPTNTIQAFIPPEDIREERTPFGDGTGWHSDGRQLTLTVIEQ